MRTTMTNDPVPCSKRRPGRPPTYIFNKPDSELSENERRLKGSVIKRRLRQNRSYHKKKRMRELAATQPPVPFSLQPTVPFHQTLPLSHNLSPNIYSLHLNAPTSNPSKLHANLPTHSRDVTLPALPFNSQHTSGVSPSQVRDEKRLIEEILNVSTKSLAESATMVRQAASNAFLTSDILTRMSTLPSTIADGVKHLLLFPSSFTAEAARHILAMIDRSPVTFTSEVLQPLVDTSLVSPLPSGRYELNEIARSTLCPDSFTIPHATRQRFVNYFSETLRKLDPHSLSMDGRERLKAMKVYDAERINVAASLQMCRDIGGRKLVMTFLTNGATVMRYSTSAHERVGIFETVLHEVEASADGLSSTNSEEARVTLALGEAYFDLLSFEKAKSFLRRAIGMMAGSNDCSFSSISTSVLALLLFAELQTSEREFEEAKKLVIQALRTLKDAGMQKSTFAVCSLLSLASVYSSLGFTEKALTAINTSMEVLTDLGFSSMPIFADALRTLGGVHLDAGDPNTAQDTFFAALTIIQKWITRADWEKAPFQHCTHLDIFLVEAIAKTYSAQHRNDEASQLMSRAMQKRIERRLDSQSAEESKAGGFPSSSKSRMYTRHLY